MQKNVGPKAQFGRTVVRVVDGAVSYERVYVKCGKRCRRCDRESPEYDSERPGHGPYWYAVLRNSKGDVVRRYIGRNLKMGKEQGDESSE